MQLSEKIEFWSWIARMQLSEKIEFWSCIARMQTERATIMKEINNGR